MRPTLTIWPSSGLKDCERGLPQLRREIDRLDDDLLELVERRLALSHQVAAAKREDGGRLKLRPRREADIVERLAARSRLANRDLIAHLWRELLGHGLQAQARTELVLWAKVDSTLLHEQVRHRFGWAAPIVWAATPESALEQANRREAIAVIENSPFHSWWLELPDYPSLAIFESTGGGGAIDGFLVGRVAPEDIADDQRYGILDKDEAQDRLAAGERIDVIRTAGSLSLCHWRPEPPGVAAPGDAQPEAASR
ncbi:MAG: chorismate mutase [Allosphingosinicella sp.]